MEQITGNDVLQLHKEHILQSWGLAGKDAIAIEKADGIYLYDYEGRRYADMSSLLVCSNLGHNNREIIEALKKQADELCYMSPAYATKSKSLLAEKLCELAGADTFQRVFFTNAGADANENAIKIARMVSGKTKILSCYRSYHGATLGASNASGDWRRFAAEIGGANGFVKFMNPHMYQDGYTRGMDDTLCTEKALKDLELQIRYEGDDIAAILMESIVGANGVILPPFGYMEGIRALCDKYDILLILDEVMSGFYRTGKPFAWQHFDLKPDMITFAKGVTGAYIPLGGVIVNKKIAAFFEQHVLQCGLTYSGHTLACGVGIACLAYYKTHHIEEHVQAMGKIVKEYMEAMVKKHACLGEARCLGLFNAFELVKDKKQRIPLVIYHEGSDIMAAILAKLKEHGFSTFGRENTIHVSPPLTITEDELRTWLPVLDEVFTWVDETFLTEG